MCRSSALNIWSDDSARGVAACGVIVGSHRRDDEAARAWYEAMDAQNVSQLMCTWQLQQLVPA
jgi:hypothetical protein